MAKAEFDKKCLICNTIAKNEKPRRRTSIKCFCRLFNLPNLPYEDQIVEEATFCLPCHENICKIEQLYRKLDRANEGIINFRNLLESQLNAKELQSIPNETLADVLSDPSKELRLKIINKIQFIIPHNLEDKIFEPNVNVDLQEKEFGSTHDPSTDDENAGSGEIDVKEEWMSPPNSPLIDNDIDRDWDSNVGCSSAEASDDKDESNEKYYCLTKNQSNENNGNGSFQRTTRRTTALARQIRESNIQIVKELTDNNFDEDIKPEVINYDAGVPNEICTTAKNVLQSTKKRIKRKRCIYSITTTKQKREKREKYRKRKIQRDLQRGECFACPRENCNMRFKNEIQVNAHVKRHHEGILRPHACPESGCGRTFRFAADLEKHEGVHTGVKPFICEFCAKCFHFEQLLNVHRSVMHLKDTPIKCEICGQGCRSKAAKEIHMRKHTKEAPFVCHCGKKYTSPHVLKSHQRSHNEEFKCIPCNKSFSTKNYLVEHNYRHNGLYPYKCPKCDYGTRRERHLRMHMNNHEGIKVECKVCGKKISERGLPKHMKIHNPERPKPFVCEQCGKGFTDGYKLKCHAVIHSEERAYECEICGKRTHSKGNLTKHMKCHEKSGISLRNQKNQKVVQNEVVTTGITNPTTHSTLHQEIGFHPISM